MLVLTRKAQEAVVIGGAGMIEPVLTITVLGIEGAKVRLGFQADTAVAVHRWEVWQRILADARPDDPAAARAPPSPG
jgi:carbon storage regulator CsrA